MSFSNTIVRRWLCATLAWEELEKKLGELSANGWTIFGLFPTVGVGNQHENYDLVAYRDERVEVPPPP